jgi:energy-coupling factor transport system ATP-binding protein
MDTQKPENLIPIRKEASMVFQNPDNQIVSTVVEEDVAFALENLGVPSADIRRRVDDALKTVGMYTYRLHAPHLLSGGQKQRVAIAGVLAIMPRCIIFDEPTSMLDPQGRAEVMQVIRHLNKAFQITIVLITHHMEEAAQAERIVVLEQGKIVMDGTPRELLTRTQELAQFGLAPPQTVSLLQEVNRVSGVLMPADALSVQECADRLETYLLEGGARA